MSIPRTHSNHRRVSPVSLDPELPKPVPRGLYRSRRRRRLPEVDAPRLQRRKSISDGERALVIERMALLDDADLFRLAVAGNILTIQEKDRLRYTRDADHFNFLESFLDDIPDMKNSYTSMLRFILIDRKRRLFVVERYCFREDVEDWVFIDGPSRLEDCLGKYLPHLGKSSFYSLRPSSPAAFDS